MEQKESHPGSKSLPMGGSNLRKFNSLKREACMCWRDFLFEITAYASTFSDSATEEWHRETPAALTKWGKADNRDGQCQPQRLLLSWACHTSLWGYGGLYQSSRTLFRNTTKATCASQLVSLTEGSERRLCESGRMFQGRSQAVRIASTLVHLPEKAASMDWSRLMREAVDVARAGGQQSRLGLRQFDQ